MVKLLCGNDIDVSANQHDRRAIPGRLGKKLRAEPGQRREADH
jgi:hypothetical protein